MSLRFFIRTLAGAGFLTASFLADQTAIAAATDYRFELVQAQAEGSGKTLVTVRLIHVPDAKPVAGAVVFESKADMDMASRGMADMVGKVSPQPADQPGLYRFQVETSMAGTWRITLGAKVQGETETVRGSVPFEAK